MQSVHPVSGRISKDKCFSIRVVQCQPWECRQFIFDSNKCLLSWPQKPTYWTFSAEDQFSQLAEAETVHGDLLSPKCLSLILLGSFMALPALTLMWSALTSNASMAYLSNFILLFENSHLSLSVMPPSCTCVNTPCSLLSACSVWFCRWACRPIDKEHPSAPPGYVTLFLEVFWCWWDSKAQMVVAVLPDWGYGGSMQGRLFGCAKIPHWCQVLRTFWLQL